MTYLAQKFMFFPHPSATSSAGGKKRALVRLLLLAIAGLDYGALSVQGALAQPAVAGTAAQSDEPGEEAGVEQGAPAETADLQAPPPGEPDPAILLFDRAMEALARGKKPEAEKLFEQLRARYPAHPLAARAEAALRAMDSAAEVSAAQAPAAQAPAAQVSGSEESAIALQPEAPENPPGPASEKQEPTGAARAELVFFQTLHGIGLGAEACLIAGCEEPQPWVLSLMLGAGAGVGLSLYFSSEGITPGLARSLTSGTEWGLYNGLMIGLASGAFEEADNEEQAVALGLGLGQLAGMGAAGLLYSTFKPTAGQVSLASSGGIWTTAVALLGLVIINPDIEDERPVFLTALVASDLGLLGGSFFAKYQPMSASRVLLIDGGGILGLLGGAGIAVLVSGDDISPELVGGLGLFGTATGLGISYYLTRNWDAADDPGPRVNLGISPATHGVTGSMAVNF